MINKADVEKFLKGKPKVDVTMSINEEVYIDFNTHEVKELDMENPHVEIKASEKDIDMFLRGTLDIYVAAVLGKVSVKGSAGCIAKLTELLDEKSS